MTKTELQKQHRRRDAKIEELAARIQELEKENKELTEEVKELKKLLLDKAKSKESKPPKEASNFSVTRQEQKQRRRRRRKKSTGRKPKDAKRDLATDAIDIY